MDHASDLIEMDFLTGFAGKWTRELFVNRPKWTYYNRLYNLSYRLSVKNVTEIYVTN